MLLAEALRGRNNNLDALRLLAAAAVVYSHAPLFSLGIAPDPIELMLGASDHSGSLAVKFFFFASGLVVTNSLMGGTSPAQWAVARVFRLFPALIGVLLFSALVLGPAMTTLSWSEYFTDPRTWEYIWRNITGLLRNCCLAWELPGVFQGRANEAVNGPLWTLPSEFRCYLVVLVVFLVTGFRTRALVGLALCLLLVAAAFDPAQVGITASSAQERDLLPCFLAGMIAALWKDKIELRVDVAGALLVAAALSRGSPVYEAFYCAAAFYGALVLAAWRPFMRLRPQADISYGVYLYGWPMQQVVFGLFPGLDRYSHTALVLCLAGGLAAASWFVIEKPCIRFGRSLAARRFVWPQIGVRRQLN